MWFLDKAQTELWCKPLDALDGAGNPRFNPRKTHALQFSTLSARLPAVRRLADGIVSAVGPWTEALLMIDPGHEWNRQNLHLYYKLRKSYGDHGRIAEAAGHCFLEYEEPDLLSFLQLCLMNEWQATLLTSEDYGRAFLSRDGLVRLASDDRSSLDQLEAELIEEGLTIERIG